MAVRPSTPAMDAMMDALAAFVNAGAAEPYLSIYTGTQPSDGDSVETGDLLVTILLNDPAFTGASSGGYLEGDATGPLSGIAVDTGTAGWARVYDSDGNYVLDGTVTETGDGGNYIIDAVAITTSDVVTLTGIDFTMPNTT